MRRRKTKKTIQRLPHETHEHRKKVNRAIKYYRSLGYNADKYPQAVTGGLWDILCRDLFDSICVQVYTDKARMQIFEDDICERPENTRRELVIYAKHQHGIVPRNRLNYPEKN